MPLKIRCKGCQKVLNVPDRARGKAIKCPGCQTVLRIPAATAAAAGVPLLDGRRPDVSSADTQSRRPSSSATGAAPAVERDDFLAGLDLRRAADTRVRVCVKCGTEADDEVVDCPECGHNVDTGIMSAYIRTKRERKGPDPEEFWGVAWTGSFKFLKENIPLVFRTAGYWVLFITLAVWALYAMALTGVMGAVASLLSGNPLVGQLPNAAFWMAVAFLMLLGMLGWFWHCTIEVIRHTMGPNRNQKMRAIHFDFYQCLALGIKALIWPAILFLPVVLVVGIVMAVPLALAGSTDVNYVFVSVFEGGLRLVSFIVFPLAMVHMAMPYTYRAWTPYHMGICLGKNILPALYWFVMYLAASLPFVATVVILHLTWDGGLVQLFLDTAEMTFDVVDWLIKLVADLPAEKRRERPWYWIIVMLALSWLPVSIFVTPFCIAAAFGAVFLMRANGYVGLYFRDRLDLVQEQSPNVPCGFWPRYLAHLVDWLLITLTLIVVGIVAALGAWLAVWAELGYFAIILLYGYRGFCIVFPWFYHAKPESNPVWRGSIGKRALGIVVVQDNPKFETLDFGKASGRFWVKTVLGVVTLGISWLIAAFTERKTALHDNIMKTLVVWEGDDERNEI